MTINAEVRRMNYTAMAGDQRARARKIIEDALAAIDPQARPESAADFRQTLAIFDEVDGIDADGMWG